jgi:hypothetical protein
MRHSANAGSLILNSWKEIATYLGRGVRTVQRWERELHLPVRRLGKGKRSPVYSTAAELNFWMSTVDFARSPRLQPQRGASASLPRTSMPFEESRRLLSSVHSLAQAIAENSVRQHHQAEILQARILQMRSRMK